MEDKEEETREGRRMSMVLTWEMDVECTTLDRSNSSFAAARLSSYSCCIRSKSTDTMRWRSGDKGGE